MTGEQHVAGAAMHAAAVDMKVKQEMIALEIPGDLAVCHQNLFIHFTPQEWLRNHSLPGTKPAGLPPCAHR